MALNERWRLIGENITFSPPEISRDSTPDEFLETDEVKHTILKFDNVLVGCKEFSDVQSRDRWVEEHPLGKRVEIENPDTHARKAGNIVEAKKGAGEDERIAAILIYIERELPPEDVADWVI
ncbi:hypothetical protein GF373_14570 [bacterium]|nr:hypothetical protein [bacterium]